MKSPGPQSGPITFKPDPGHPKPVSAPLSSPLQAGLSNIQKELGKAPPGAPAGPTSFNLPRLVDPNAHYLSRDPSGRITRSQRFQLNANSPYMLGATSSGHVVAPSHEVSLLGNAPRRMDQGWYERWFEEGYCSKSTPEQCDKLKNLKRFYHRPYERLLAGMPLPRLPEKYDKPPVSSSDFRNRIRKYWEGRYDIDQPSMSKADYLKEAMSQPKFSDKGARQNPTTLDELERMEYNLKMTQRAKKEGWPTGEMPIDPSLYARTEANREAIYEHKPKDKSYGTYWDEQHQNKHWWDYLAYINPLAQGVKALKARENYAAQFSDPVHDLYNKRKFLFEHPNWLKQHPEDKEKYMIGFLGNRLPKPWYGKIGTGIGDFGLGLLDVASNPIGAADSFIKSVSTIPDDVAKECTAPGVNTKSCVWANQLLRPTGLGSIADVGWQSGTPLDSPIRSEPTLHKALDIAGQSGVLLGSLALPVVGEAGEAGAVASRLGALGEAGEAGAVASRLGGLGEAGETARVAGMTGRGLAGESTAGRAAQLSENTIPKTVLSSEGEVAPQTALSGKGGLARRVGTESQVGQPIAPPSTDLARPSISSPAETSGKVTPKPEQLVANEKRMKDLSTWRNDLSPEQNFEWQKELDDFMVETDQLRQWEENPAYAEEQPTYFTHPRYELFRNDFDEALMNEQADTLLSDSEKGRAMRMNDRLAILKNARKSPPERFNLEGYTSMGETPEFMEKDAIYRELMEYGKNLKTFRPQAKLPKPPSYSKLTRLYDKARWKLKPGKAAGMPNKGVYDDWLGPRFKKGEDLSEWLSQPKAEKYYKKLQSRLKGDPRMQKWSTGAEYPTRKPPPEIEPPEAPSAVSEGEPPLSSDETAALKYAEKHASIEKSMKEIDEALKGIDRRPPTEAPTAVSGTEPPLAQPAPRLNAPTAVSGTKPPLSTIEGSIKNIDEIIKSLDRPPPTEAPSAVSEAEPPLAKNIDPREFKESVEDITSHLKRPKDERLLTIPRSKPEPVAQASMAKPYTPKEAPELHRNPSPLLKGYPPGNSTLEDLRRMTSIEQMQIDTTHLINDSSYPEAFKNELRREGKSEEFIRQAESKNIDTQVKNYHSRRNKMIEKIEEENAGLAESGKKRFSLFSKKPKQPEINTNELINKARKSRILRPSYDFDIPETTTFDRMASIRKPVRKKPRI
ncbi:MAG: hypothetical protein N0E44_19530 [Candidatus Thiodiazotropha lotti]|nr:hypothetical protein [Candidatus Thiodiazotropha lotti]MCW4222072.1 hypothetical protein [Candidatus Thiodiazotropha lotti]